MEITSFNPATSSTGGGYGEPKQAARRGAASAEVSPDEQRQLQELKQRDREVRAHEAAHLAAAGAYAQGGAKLEYVRGPDGKLYANGGEVSIDSSPVPGDPRATLEKAQTVQRAALAPADPSPQDRRIAAEAAAMAVQASAEMARENDSTDESGDTQADASRRLQERIVSSGAVTARFAAVHQPLHLVA